MLVEKCSTAGRYHWRSDSVKLPFSAWRWIAAILCLFVISAFLDNIPDAPGVLDQKISATAVVPSIHADARIRLPRLAQHVLVWHRLGFFSGVAPAGTVLDVLLRPPLLLSQMVRQAGGPSPPRL